MVVSGFFSGLIYIAIDNEISGGMSNLGSRIIVDTDSLTQKQIIRIQNEESENARKRIVYYLYVLNMIILMFGGVASYLIARKTINSIETSHRTQIRFTADASHELRTPLAAMKSEIEASLYDKNITKTELRQTLESAVEEVDKMTGLTSMLLDLSRVNTIDFDEKPVEIQHAIQSTIDRIDSPNRINFKHSRPVYIRGNEVAIETVINILIDNALKYSSEKSKISIETTQSSSKVYIKVSNFGSGIAKEDIGQIFEHFYRGRNSIKNRSGYGMGLALAKEIVEHHNGRIDVKSTTGKLTIFTVVIPKSNRSLSVI